MRWIAIALLICSSATWAQWVQFDACGFMTDALDNIDTGMTFMPAPHLGPVWIWVPSISVITALNERATKDNDILHCVRLQVGGHSVNVVGKSTEIKRKIAEARGY